MSKGLGPRGREALFSSNVNIHDIQENDTYKELPIHTLYPCSFQPRKHFDEENLKELASSIKEKGIVQPLVVRKLESDRYEIVAGERRFRAAKIVGLEKIPVIIREYSDSETMTIALVENLQRENLNPIEEAEAFAYLKDTYNFSQEELAKNLGKSRPSIANALRLLNLPEEIRTFLLEGALSGAHGRTLLALSHGQLILPLAERIMQYRLSVRDTENLVDYANAHERLPELTATPAQSDETNNSNAKKASPKRRSVAKSDFFKSLQSQLRKEVHRGTTISGTLENGKIVLPFAGKDEFEALLKLLALGGVDEFDAAPKHNTQENPDTLHAELAHFVEEDSVVETKNLDEELEDFIRESKADENFGTSSDENNSELHSEIIQNIVGDVQSEISSEADFVGFPFEESQNVKIDIDDDDEFALPDEPVRAVPDSKNIFAESVDELDAALDELSDVFKTNLVDADDVDDLDTLA